MTEVLSRCSDGRPGTGGDSSAAGRKGSPGYLMTGGGVGRWLRCYHRREHYGTRWLAESGGGRDIFRGCYGGQYCLANKYRYHIILCGRMHRVGYSGSVRDD